MAIGTKSDFIIWDDQFHSGMSEVLAQEANVFNGASNGTMVINTVGRVGDYGVESFYKTISGLIQDRDPTSTAAATASKLTQDSLVSVKLNKMALVEQTLDSFKKKGVDSREMSFVLGSQFAKAVLIDYITNGVGSAAAAIGQHNEQNNDTGTITTAGLVQALSVLGDRGGDVAAFVMHSKAYYDLVQSQIAANIFDVSSVNIKQGSPITLGRPVIVTDSASLISTGTGPTGVDEYYTLALTSNAIKVEESEERNLHSDIIGGKANLVLQWQAEYAYNLALKGYKYDTVNGGANPNLAALTTATNWDKAVTDNKDLLGVRLVTQ